MLDLASSELDQKVGMDGCSGEVELDANVPATSLALI